MPQTQITAVFDCNIIWQAFFFKNGVSAKCKQLVDREVITLFLSPEVLEEMREVMTRPEFLERFRSVTVSMVERYLAELAKKSEFLRNVPKTITLPRDPDDEPYINLAFESKAQYLVTRDKDLLDLMTAHDIESKAFRQKTHPLRIIGPAEFIRLVKPERLNG